MSRVLSPQRRMTGRGKGGETEDGEGERDGSFLFDQRLFSPPPHPIWLAVRFGRIWFSSPLSPLLFAFLFPLKPKPRYRPRTTSPSFLFRSTNLYLPSRLSPFLFLLYFLTLAPFSPPSLIHTTSFAHLESTERAKKWEIFRVHSPRGQNGPVRGALPPSRFALHNASPSLVRSCSLSLSLFLTFPFA